MKSLPIVFIVGPSAVGKSRVAFELAQLINGEIVSCDAMQVYKEAAIASDKPDESMRQTVRHYCLDLVSVEEEFDVVRFRQEALKAIEKIRSRNKCPIVAGGSGLYMSILLDGIFEQKEISAEIKARLQSDWAESGHETLFKRLESVDPAAAAKIHYRDKRRILRALEVFEQYGRPISAFQQERSGLWGQTPVRCFILNRPRAELYKRAEQRIDAMFHLGLLDEMQAIMQLNVSKTAQGLIGYPEFKAYRDKVLTIQDAKELIKKNTRNYIKRQLTWFRRDKRLEWVDMTPDADPSSVARKIQQALKEKREDL